jgi:hypothetical protein
VFVFSNLSWSCPTYVPVSQPIYAAFRSKAYAAFNRALNDTINSIEQETGEANLICNLTFLDEYLVRFTQACPNWSEAYDEISEKWRHLEKMTRCVQSKKQKNDSQ